MVHNGGPILMVQLENEFWRVRKVVADDDAATYLTVRSAHLIYCPLVSSPHGHVTTVVIAFGL
jgi:hypothetical protein